MNDTAHDPTRAELAAAPSAGSEAHELEAVGPNFSIDGMLHVRGRTRHAISVIAERIRPGMTEEHAVHMAKQCLRELGLRRGWHKTYVRFGRNTVREYGNASEEGVVLAENDIFFVDIGPAINNLEGDGGATFVVGTDPEMWQARQDALRLWHRVHEAWCAHRWTGRSLYKFAEAEAAKLGWILNLRRMSGHRIGDFPHKHRYAGLLSDVDLTPSPFVWVLEIHIRHPRKEFGAFYEDLLLPLGSVAPEAMPERRDLALRESSGERPVAPNPSYGRTISSVDS